MNPLSKTNPYLKDKKTAKALNLRSTRTSCGVEGIVAHSVKIHVKPDTSKTDAVFQQIQSRLCKS
jgi:hypothetical protein